MPKVGVGFCGNCMPGILIHDVFRHVKALAGDISFADLGETDLDAYLFICGCEEICPVEEMKLQGHPKAVVVAGDMVNGEPVMAFLPEKEIAQAVVEKLRSL